MLSSNHNGREFTKQIQNIDHTFAICLYMELFLLELHCFFTPLVINLQHGGVKCKVSLQRVHQKKQIKGKKSSKKMVGTFSVIKYNRVAATLLAH